jgi:hypothetical protein
MRTPSPRTPVPVPHLPASDCDTRDANAPASRPALADQGHLGYLDTHANNRSPWLFPKSDGIKRGIGRAELIE